MSKRFDILTEMKNHEVNRGKFESLLELLKEGEVKIKLEIKIISDEGDMFTTSTTTTERVNVTEEIFTQYIHDELEATERVIQKLIEELK